MPGRLLYDFAKNGVHWYVQLDETTQTIYAESNPPNAQYPTVIEADLNGRKIGQVLYSYCEGTTLVKIVVRLNYPYAEFQRVLNSPSCGYVPPDPCIFGVIIIDPVDESEAGKKDGSIKIQASMMGRPLEYSLDGLHWQTVSDFRNLAPGKYDVYIRVINYNECVRKFSTVVAPGVIIPVIPYPWQEKVCKIFRLIQDGVPYIVTEPVRWDQVEIKGNRDKTYHGWRSQYSDGKIDLEFSCEQGRQIIINEYEAHGNDGFTQFQYGFVYQGEYQVLFDGKLNYNTYKKKRSTVAISIESKDYNDTFNSRIDTKVSLTDIKTQDGNNIAAPKIINVGLHGKAIATQFRVNNTTQFEYTIIEQGRRFYALPQTIEATANEISDTYPTSLIVTTEAPYDVDLYAHDIKYAGQYSFDIKFVHDIKMRAALAGNYTLRAYFMINDVKYEAGPVINDDIFQVWESIRMNFSYQGVHTLQPGDKIYWFFQMDLNGILQSPVITQISVDINVQALEEAEGSSTNGWLLFDVCDYVARNITDNFTYLNSGFLAVKSSLQAIDGEGSLYVLTNGKQIRRYNTQDYPLKISMSECLEIVRTLFCCGYGFEKSGGNEFIRIERVNYFYQNKKIIQIDNPFEYYEEAALDQIYNETEYGYEKYLEEGVNTLDEYNTYHQGLLPIKTEKKKLVIKCPAIASGYSIEKCRRNQYEDTPSDSVENDDEPFIIAVTRDATNKYKAERDEAFDVVNNVISPSTAYNLRLTPRRMEINWSVWVSNILHYKQPVEEIKTTFIVQNAKLQTKLKMSDLRPVGDIFKDLWQEDQSIQVGAYPVAERIFRPEYINVKAKITPDLYVKLDKAMRGEDSSTTNYGYVVVKDNDGLYQAGFLMEVTYNFYSELVSMKLLKKHDSPVNPDEECCNYLTINGCRILINGHKITV